MLNIKIKGKIYKWVSIMIIMVYIYKKIIGGKEYYYLRASEKKGKRTLVKDIAYLGNDITKVKDNLSKFSKYKDEIRKAYKKINLFIESNYYINKAKEQKLKKDEFLGENLNEIEACKIHFEDFFEKTDKKTKEEILKNFIIEFSFNSSSIEGNTINLNEARNLLQEGITPKDKTLREIYDLQNSERVFFSIFNELKDKEIAHELIIEIHDKLLENIDLRKGYRTVDIRVARSNFEATPAPYVKTDMDILLKWYNKNKEKLHPFVLASIFHHKFEKIHPFMDGNGRTGRMLLNFILLENNYPPMILYKKYREEYLNSMRKADESSPEKYEKKDYYDLIQFNAKQMSESYWNIFL